MKLNYPVNQPHTRAKIIGIILLLIGAGFLFNPTPTNIKISFTSMLIGVIWVILITEKSIPKNISDAQIQGTFDVLEKIIGEYNLSGNAVFLPKSRILTEERIYIPQDKSDRKLPYINNDSVIIRNAEMEILGLSLLPPGIKLLKEIEKEVDFEDIGIENVEEKLQKFVGMNLLKSIHLKERPDGYRLEIEQPIFCKYDQNLCRQYPCPTCGAALIAIIRATKEKLWIKDTTYNDKKITFHLNFIRREIK